MPSLTEELESWFKGRPLWLQDAARRLIEKGELDEEDYVDLLKICGTEAGVEFEGEEIPLAKSTPAAAFTKEEHAHKVEICSISNVVGVNALNPKKPLNIPDGLTVIFGQNSAGKSGYTRLLKHVCGAKNPGQLYPDAFKDRPASQSCKIEYKYDGNEDELNWDITQGINKQLSAIELYDTACGSVYVIYENQLAYEPPLLRLFAELTATSDILSDRLDGLSRTLVSAKPLLPNEYWMTKLGQWYQTLTSATTEATIEQKCAWSEEDQQLLDALNLRLKSPDPKASAEAIRKSKLQVDKLLAGFRNWDSKLSDDACSTYIVSKKDCSDKKIAASEYAKSIFEKSPLTGIGEDAWNLLWEQARAYSQKVAYPQAEFPNIGDDAVCVLCQQPLVDDEVKRRLTDFERFVKGELESAAKTAKETLDVTEESLKHTPEEELITSMITGAGLDDAMSKRLLALRESITQKTKELLETEICKEFTAGMDFTVLDELVTLLESMGETEKQFEEDAKEDKREVIKKEALELNTKKWISQQKDAIFAEILVLGKRAKITQAKQLVNTTALTRKKSSLAEELVTAEYIQRFENEIEKLGAGRIKVNLEKTRSDKGRVYFQIKLEGNQLELPVDKILSEGEFRIISLAAFLADVEGHADKSTFIFDDPISSLDQDYEEKVAERLVELSKSRQVLVFTHRLSLMALIEEAVKKQGLAQNIIGLYKEPWGTGEPGLPPIYAQKTKAAINTLISKIPEGRKILDEQGNEPYSWWVKGMCSNSRITLEKVIEFDLLADVVQRFRRSITTQGKLHNVAKVTSKDCAYIDGLMTKYSRYEHSQPKEVSLPPLEPDELETDLNQLKEWRDNFTKR
ncbi:AAA family ATPase [candidate division KSB1 bacterium]|nr:AAA family ATPase [candidate division KSB1 bacterium]